MGIADTEAALEKLREFLTLLEASRDDSDAWQRAVGMQRLVEGIAREIDPGNVARLAEKDRHGGWSTRAARTQTLRLIGILEHDEEFQRILGQFGPTLAANRLHRWVWDAAASLWDGGHYDSAVHAAAKAVERHTQVRIGRLDLDGKALYGQAFSIRVAKPSELRLRFPDINRTEEPKRWTSAHEGAQNLGMGCAQGIRNPQAHPSPDLTEQEALEQLAALSVLARWVDECEAVGVDEGAAGE